MYPTGKRKNINIGKMYVYVRRIGGEWDSLHQISPHLQVFAR